MRSAAQRRGGSRWSASRGRDRKRFAFVVILAAAIIAAAGVLVGLGLGGPSSGGSAGTPISASPHATVLPHTPGTYLGVFAAGAPASYAGVQEFAAKTGVTPGVVVYYSGWPEPFQAGFAEAAARHHAVPLVQMDPTHISLAAIAAGQYDNYLRTYAAAVKKFGTQVILSFGHEMNGSWYSWGYRNTSPAVFVAAWRHIVTVFRRGGADNVTWLWTVNIVGRRAHIPSPAAWWPGSSYVTWVGIDGYYYKPSWRFAPLFGPTIKAVRALTIDPILITETAVAPAAGKPAKIADLFAGIHAYGLLGFVWFDVDRQQAWRLSSPAAFAAYRQGAQKYGTPDP
jgi:mannan endo-1,4-beta-mannosidase